MTTTTGLPNSTAPNLCPLYASTSCFTAGHLNQINYYIYNYKDTATSQPPSSNTNSSSSTGSSSSSSTSAIYEVESSLRRLFPEAIIFLYTKEIYFYDLNTDGNNTAYERFNSIISSTEEDNGNLNKLQLTSQGSFHSQTIFNTSGQQQQQQQQQQPPNNNTKSLPLIYINFLKAVKKFVFWKLSVSRNGSGERTQQARLIAFGNHAIYSSQHNNTYKLAMIDPVYNFNDELLLNICTKSQLNFQRLDHHVSMMKKKQFIASTTDRYAIYLAPSAVRVYLADESLETSILESPPANYQKLLTLLKNYCNISFNEEEEQIRWIKIVPNLNHLNHLTPVISNYLKDFNTGLKYIVWPLQLCFIQKGSYDLPQETQEEQDLKANTFGDLFQIIDEFVEYNKELENEKKHISIVEPEPVAEPTSEGIKQEDVDVVVKNDDDALKMFDDTNKETTPIHDIKDEDADGEGDVNMSDNDNNDDNWDTELFGSAEGEEEEDQEQDPEQQEMNGKEPSNEIPESGLDFFNDAFIDEEIDKYFSDNDNDEAFNDDNQEKKKEDEQEGKAKAEEDHVLASSPPIHEDNNNNNKNSQEEAKDHQDPDVSFIDTSKFMKAAGTDNSFYEDPGAPAPVPFAIIQENARKSTYSSGSTEGAAGSGAGDHERKSVFAPLNFNPAIQESIDSKYLNGGKFYVPSQNDSDADTSIAAGAATETIDTSIKSYTPITPSLRKGKFEAMNVVSSSDDSDSSDDEALSRKHRGINGDDEDDDDEDEEGNDDDDDDDEDQDMEQDDDSSPKDNMQSTGLGLINFKREGLIAAEDDKLNNLAMSSPMRKADLALAPIPGTGTGMTPDISSPNPNTATMKASSSSSPSENQNWLPFLLKWIPIYTLPTNFLYANPQISRELLEDTLPILVSMFVFDAFNKNSTSTEDNLKCLQFKKDAMDKCDSEFMSLLDETFPGLEKTPINDLIKQKANPDYTERSSFELLTGNNSTITKNVEIPIPDDDDEPKFIWGTGYNETATTEQEQNDTNELLSKFLFRLSEPMTTLRRMDQALNINLASLRFWNLLNLQPSGAEKHFDTIMVLPSMKTARPGESSARLTEARNFMQSITDEFNNSRLGSMQCDRFNVYNQSPYESYSWCDGVLDLGLSDSSDEDIWKDMNEYMIKFAQNLKEQWNLREDLSSASARSRPLLLLFVNPINTFASFVEISKIILNFKKTLTGETIDSKDSQDKKKKKRKISTAATPDGGATTTGTTYDNTSDMVVLNKVLPLDLFHSIEQAYTIVSHATLNRLALDLYNLCPSSTVQSTSTSESEAAVPSLIQDPCVTISPPLPKKIQYKLTKNNIARNLNSSDLYIHLAYERSVDKNWCVATWSDQYGKITNAKAWYCPPTPLGSGSTNSNKTNSPQPQQQSLPHSRKTFEQISNEIWDITLNYIRSHNGKSFLVLTRLNNIIADDELVHWKRLSLKTKNLLLIVLAVNLNSTLVLKSTDVNVVAGSRKTTSGRATSLSDQAMTAQNSNREDAFSKRPDSGGGMMSNTGLTPFLVGNGDSPEMYMTGGGSGSGGHHSNNGNGGITTGTPLEMNSPTMVQTPQASRYSTTTTAATTMAGALANAEDVSIVDLSDDAHGLILPNPIPLSNQQNRISIKTGYLMKTSLQQAEQKKTIGGGVSEGGYTPVPVPSSASHLPYHQIHHQHHHSSSAQQIMYQQQQQQQHQQQRQTNKSKPSGSNRTYYIRSDNVLEVNLMSCPNFLSGLELMKTLLHQYRDLSSLATCWGMNDTNNLHIGDLEHEEMMIPWHILSARKLLNALVNINVTE